MQAGRLAGRNPAYVNPALRRHLLQLLTDMEHSPDSRLREGETVSQGPARPLPIAPSAIPFYSLSIIIYSIYRYFL